MKLDPAVGKLLCLDVDVIKVSSTGGGGCSAASTSKIISTLKDGTDRAFFMKTSRGKEAEAMFEGVLKLFSAFC